jgi:hypothetical protein
MDPMPGAIPFERCCALVQRRAEEIYGIPVVTRDIPDPLTGDLDGSEIHIDYALNFEQRLFLLAHLFGHTVEWNTDAAWLALGRPQTPPVAEDRLPALVEYERTAAEYGLALLHEAGIHEADQWYSDYTACDRAYLLHFYRTGEKREFGSFWRDGAALIEARAIPPFTPVKRVFRMDGVVI